MDALYAATPVPSGCRVNHVRGIVVEGRFRPSYQAQMLFQAKTLTSEVVARFSSSSGNREISENDPEADPRGLAVAIGDELVLVGHSVATFPTRTAEIFLQFITGTEQGDRWRQLDTPRAYREQPSSFTALHYHMLHAYIPSNVDGRSIVGRLVVFGAETSVPSTPGKDCLSRELRSRLAHAPIELSLVFTPAGTEDALDDITVP